MKFSIHPLFMNYLSRSILSISILLAEIAEKKNKLKNKIHINEKIIFVITIDYR